MNVGSVQVADNLKMQHEFHLVLSDSDRRFAAAVAAMQGLIARDGLPHSGDEVVRLAVRFADRLLLEIDTPGGAANYWTFT